jgi:predicted N-acetyltransferase YhbS
LNANLFEDPDFAPDLCIGCLEGGELVAMAMAVSRGGDRPAGGSIGHLKVLHARHDARSDEILIELLERIETSLRRRGAWRVETDGAAPVYLLPGLPRRERATREPLETAGYRRIDARRSMTARLAGADLDTGPAEERLRGSGIIVRRGEEYDRAAIPAQVRALFSESFACEVDRALDGASKGSVHLATRGDRLAGFSVAALWAANAFGPIGTAAGFEGRGVGAVLLKRALKDLRDGGISTGVIPWVGPEEFYRRTVGAETTLEYDVLAKELGNRPRP